MKKLKRFFWCKNNKSIHPFSQKLDLLIYSVIAIIDCCDNVKVEISYYYITITTPLTTVKFWNANKFYGWLSGGEINGVKFDYIGPSSMAMYDLKECLKRNGYNINIQTDQHKDISLEDLKNVKC